MKTKKGLVSILFTSLLCFISGCNDTEQDLVITASCDLVSIQAISDSTYNVSNTPMGQVLLTQVDSVVSITVNLMGFLPNTVHAVHIHEGTCELPGKHWNTGVPHSETFCNTRSLGLPWAKPLAGDVGNVSVGYDGSGSLTIKTDLWRIGSGNDLDVLGKAIVIHESYQDFTDECDPFHDHLHAHDNPKLACGVIL